MNSESSSDGSPEKSSQESHSNKESEYVSSSDEK